MNQQKPPVHGLSADRLAVLTRKLQSHVDEGQLAGSVVTIARHGETAYSGAFGMADIAARRPMQADSLFRIYSMTKAVTCAAILMLMEEGKLRLGDPVSAFIPAFRNTLVFDTSTDGDGRLSKADRGITIFDLLTHTSGLSYGFNAGHVDNLYRKTFWNIDIEDYKAPPAERQIDPVAAAIASLEVAHRQTLEQIVDAVARLPLAHQPGTRYRYSVATDVLGLIVERVSGSTLADFFQSRIFEPLGMPDTAFHVPAEKTGRFTTQYGKASDGTLIVSDAATTSLFLKAPICCLGGSGLISTAADYLRFATMLLNQGKSGGTRLLSRKTVELMTTDHMPDTFPGGTIPVLARVSVLASSAT